MEKKADSINIGRSRSLNNKLRVLLIGNYAANNQKSMQRFATMMKKGLEKRGHYAILAIPTAIFGKFFADTNKGLGKWLAYIDKFIVYPFYLIRQAKKFDLVHICDHGNSIYSLFTGRTPCVVTCHDTMAIRCALGKIKENKLHLTGRIFQKLIAFGIKKSDYVVCISKKTKSDLLKILRIDRISLVYNGQVFKPMPKKVSKRYLRKLKVNIPYFLHVGNNNWYKNRIGVLKIFSDLELPGYGLVMVGASFSRGMKDFVAKHNLPVREITSADDNELGALYSNAEALIFPSLEEGFGWPIIEAQACGCPVFTTDRNPMKEVAGDGAIYFQNPESHRQCADIIINNLAKARNKIKKGLENAASFKPSYMIDGYIKIYKSLKK